MALTSVAMEFGAATDLRGGDYTKAAVRALEAALRRNSLTVADAFGVAREAMVVKILIGVARPELVDKEAVAAALPYGSAEVIVEEGGLDIPTEDGGQGVVMASAAATVYLDLPAPAA